ncbi:hypothetical protein IE53DRAFT_390214 [Violaceomyces palustris]|uniref:Uncharacterized protein n=1 Tax=Violaceomyces palustris TaxID=1673888 RepID=A0ACD0NPD3_9BASI|nr:hypothetical protein IE53DRAFT_390214 [Violaceomyces palustris]
MDGVCVCVCVCVCACVCVCVRVFASQLAGSSSSSRMGNAGDEKRLSGGERMEAREGERKWEGKARRERGREED